MISFHIHDVSALYSHWAGSGSITSELLVVKLYLLAGDSSPPGPRAVIVSWYSVAGWSDSRWRLVSVVLRERVDELVALEER